MKRVMSEEDYPFMGTYDGDGYVIKNMMITQISQSNSRIGLFAHNEGMICNVHLEDIDIRINANREAMGLSELRHSGYLEIGGLVGRNYKGNGTNTAIVEGCSVSGTIYADAEFHVAVGGIVGCGQCTGCTNYADIDVSYMDFDDIHCSGDVGGITGQSATVSGNIEKCVNYGNVCVTGPGILCCGGISGEYGTVANCVNYGNITGVSTDFTLVTTGRVQCNVGGITGGASTTAGSGASYCVNFGDITAKKDCEKGACRAGGIVASFSGSAAQSRTPFLNCYNLGKQINADLFYDSDTYEKISGRIIGWEISSGYVSECYSADLTCLNGSIPSATGPETKQGGTMGYVEICQAIRDILIELGLPTEDVIPKAEEIFNNHKYAVYDLSMTWTEAKEYCENLGGHLVTITSAEEQAFIDSILPSGSMNLYWNGLTEADEGNWLWVTGEAAEYFNWAAGEPNNQFSGTEKYCQIYRKAYASGAVGEWNDAREEGGTEEFYRLIHIGFICEYDLSGSTLGEIRYFREWDAENQIAYFGFDDILGSRVTAETEVSFTENPTALLGQYVLVETKPRTDGTIGPDTLISVKAVETKTGTVSAANEVTITIDGVDYATPENLTLPSEYVGEKVRYYLFNGSIVSMVIITEKKDGFGQDIWEEFKADPEMSYLIKYREKWTEAYNDFIAAAKQQLEEYAGKTDTSREKAIKQEAARMKEHDLASFSKYISGNLEEYEDSAYWALAAYFYDEVDSKVPDLSSIDLSKDEACSKIVNTIMKNIGGGSPVCYEVGGNTFEIRAMDSMGLSFGSMVITDGKTNESKTVVICSTNDECRETVAEYVEELRDLATKASYNVALAVWNDVLSKSIWTLSEDYLKEVSGEIEKKLGIVLSEEFKVAGVGDLFKTLDTCYTYYTWMRDVESLYEKLADGEIEEVLEKMEKLEFKDTTMKAGIAKEALKKLKKAADKLNEAINNYLAGTLVEKEESFWKTLFECPVSIAVYSSSGEQIGYVDDEELWCTDGIRIIRAGDIKEIDVLTEDLPTFVVTATDYGAMSCCFEEYDDTFSVVGRLNYYDIPLVPAKEFTVTIVNDLATNWETLAIESGGERTYADRYISAEEDACAFVTCAVEGIADCTVYGTGVYVIGNEASVSVKQYENYIFLGWFDNGTLVSNDIVYDFVVKGDCHLVAKFKESETVRVELLSGEGGAVVGSGTYNRGKAVAILAIPDDGYSFTGWYMNGSLVAESDEYSIKVFEDITLEASFSVHTHMYNPPVFAWAEDNSCSASFQCEVCEDVQIFNCAVTSTTTAGETVHTATVDFDGQTYTDTYVVAIPPANHTVHTADSTWHCDSTSHWHECAVCGEKMDVIRHSGGTATCSKQAECEICGIAYGDPAPHDYEVAWTQAGEAGHWHVCKNCSAHDSVVPHVPGAAATATTAQTCTKCGYVIAPTTSHTHTTDSTWHSNGTYHWHLCTSCGAWVSTSQHSYSSDTDTTCNICGYIRTIDAAEPTVETEETVAETEEAQTSENTTATEALKPTTDDMQENGEVSLSNDGTDNTDSSGVGGILIAALAIIMVGSLAGLAALFIYKRRHGTE